MILPSVLLFLFQSQNELCVYSLLKSGRRKNILSRSSWVQVLFQCHWSCVFTQPLYMDGYSAHHLESAGICIMGWRVEGFSRTDIFLEPDPFFFCRFQFLLESSTFPEACQWTKGKMWTFSVWQSVDLNLQSPGRSRSVSVTTSWLIIYIYTYFSFLIILFVQAKFTKNNIWSGGTWRGGGWREGTGAWNKLDLLFLCELLSYREEDKNCFW